MACEGPLLKFPSHSPFLTTRDLGAVLRHLEETEYGPGYSFGIDKSLGGGIVFVDWPGRTDGFKAFRFPLEVECKTNDWPIHVTLEIEREWRNASKTSSRVLWNGIRVCVPITLRCTRNDAPPWSLADLAKFRRAFSRIGVRFVLSPSRAKLLACFGSPRRIKRPLISDTSSRSMSNEHHSLPDPH